MIKRAFILTEHGQLLLRHDKNVNGNDNIEKDLFEFIKILDKKGIIRSKKLMNLLKVYHGINFSDTIEIIKNEIKNKNTDWYINKGKSE